MDTEPHEIAAEERREDAWPEGAPEGDKRARFHRNAPRRVDKVLHALAVLKHCAGPAYESTDDERDDIVQALVAGLEDCLRAFRPRPPRPQQQGFSFGKTAAEKAGRKKMMLELERAES